MSDAVLAVLAQVAEQMGFLTPTGPGDGPPPGALLAAVPYAGAGAGRVVVAAAPELAQALARNLLALDPDAAVAERDAQDALRELCNVVAGNLLPVVLGEGEYRLGAPEPGPWPAAAAFSAGLACAEGGLAVAVERG